MTKLPRIEDHEQEAPGWYLRISVDPDEIDASHIEDIALGVLQAIGMVSPDDPLENITAGQVWREGLRIGRFVASCPEGWRVDFAEDGVQWIFGDPTECNPYAWVSPQVHLSSDADPYVFSVEWRDANARMVGTRRTAVEAEVAVVQWLAEHRPTQKEDRS